MHIFVIKIWFTDLVYMSVIKVNKSINSSQFWNAVEIYYKHPNSINKQVLFSKDVLVAELHPPLTFIECRELFDNLCLELSKDCTLKDFIGGAKFSKVNIVDIKDAGSIFSLYLNKMYLFVRVLYPKLTVNDYIEFFEFIFLDKIAAKVYIFTKCVFKTCEDRFNQIKSKEQNPFATLKFNFLELSLNGNYLEIHYNEDLEEKGLTWLHTTFVSKFTKLLSSGDIKRMKNKNTNAMLINNNVDIVQYYKFYNEMKLKYAKFFVQNWTENTDPKKFVYEDIGIATYLIMLWNGGSIPKKNSKKQKFVDLGCGNGLLVHILNSEGHLGLGLDIRKRKIWDIYPSTTLLQETTIIPSHETTYPQADWLIGNHSDELTAWIPIMARLSNSHCQYFVLPCCPYELNGMKFQRKNSSFSSYQDFINYVKEISLVCNFETSVDKLRIPSTKRICLVGSNKTEMSKDKYMSVKQSVIRFISQNFQYFTTRESKIYNKTGNHEKDQVFLDIKVRTSVELVRNCSRLPQGFIDSILRTTMNELLKEQIICIVIKNGKSFAWNRGRKLSVGDIASCLDKNLLTQLKNECKGLQTLFKNHHFLFDTSQGCVQFRSPESMLEICNKFSEKYTEKWKLKKCWFFNNHPDKCPLSDDVCSYSHSK